MGMPVFPTREHDTPLNNACLWFLKLGRRVAPLHQYVGHLGT